MKIFSRLIANLRKLPGVGPKQAERFSLYVLKASGSEVNELIESINEIRDNTVSCRKCFNYSLKELCHICSDSQRNGAVICVVENAQDLEAIEKTGFYKGLYHVLGGYISPVEGVERGHIRLKELVERVKDGSVEEVIIATNPSAEGETTAIYVHNGIKEFVPKISRIAFGIPLGGDINYMDELTITHSLEGRRKI
ncbi:MAG: recombination protein RecR [Elusimicrobia bacterium CG08_land_8_20_14_0_20_51_18]|nr:MAG: recombination protein RecR [Elusimicrobia bacterium CG08_land_8_20_14_0_20_51_18]